MAGQGIRTIANKPRPIAINIGLSINSLIMAVSLLVKVVVSLGIGAQRRAASDRHHVKSAMQERWKPIGDTDESQSADVAAKSHIR